MVTCTNARKLPAEFVYGEAGKIDGLWMFQWHSECLQQCLSHITFLTTGGWYQLLRAQLKTADYV